MDPTSINTNIGIFAGLVSIVVGAITLYEWWKKIHPPKQKAGTNGPPKTSTTGGGPGKPTERVPGVQELIGDDKAYQQWLTNNPQGYVINTPRVMPASNMILHKAACSHVSNFNARKQGAFTERDFVKVCSANLAQLREWVKKNGRPDGTFTGECSVCKPH